MKYCSECGIQLEKSQSKYCSNLCQSKNRYHKYIEDWKSGETDGSRGINTRNISNHIKHYLVDKYGERCCVCRWNKKHSVTGNVPLEIDHIDGNSENNNENNLRLICPNCHALSANYKNLNMGHGRIWRKKKYLKTVDFTQNSDTL